MSYYGEPQQQPGGIVRGIEAFEKLFLLGFVAFIVYEMMKFGGSGVGKALGQMFGGAAGFMTWLSGHPNWIVAAFFGVLLTPLLQIIAGGTFKAIEKRAENTKLMRITELQKNISEDAMRQASTKRYTEDLKAEAQRERASGGSSDSVAKMEADAKIGEAITAADEAANDKEEQQEADEAKQYIDEAIGE